MKLFIFDCDGTLVDSEVIATQVFTSYWATHGVYITEEEFKEKFIGKGNNHPDNKAIFSLMPDHANEEGDKLLDEALKADVEAVQGIPELLTQLKSKLCVGSNSKLNYVKTVLNKTHLTQFFGKNIFSAEHVPHSKPAPDLFLSISKSLGFLPKDCVVVEDSPSGVLAAQRADMPVIGFSGAAHFTPSLKKRLQETTPDWFCSNVDELKSLLIKLENSFV